VTVINVGLYTDHAAAKVKGRLYDGGAYYAFGGRGLRHDCAVIKSPGGDSVTYKVSGQRLHSRIKFPGADF